MCVEIKFFVYGFVKIECRILLLNLIKKMYPIYFQPIFEILHS